MYAAKNEMRGPSVGRGSLLAMFLLLISTFPQSQQHACDKKDASIAKFYTMSAAGEFHCLFVPPGNQDDVLLKNGPAGGYEFTSDDARAYCRKYNASLPLIRNRIMHTDLHFRLMSDPDMMMNGVRWWYPMGVKSQAVEVIETDPCRPPACNRVENVTMNVTWLSGESSVIRTSDFFRRYFTWTNPAKDEQGAAAITYFRAFGGDFYTETPANTRGDVKLVCHQDPDHPYTITDDETPKDMCDGSDPKIELAWRFYTSGGNNKAHCVFHAPLQSSVVSKGDESGVYEFTLDDLDTHCMMYDARVLEIRDNDTFQAVLKEAERIGSVLDIYPLGIAHKAIIAGELQPTKPPRYAVSSVTWDDGRETSVRDEGTTSMSMFGNVPWTVESPGGVTFLTMPEGHYITRDPKQVDGKVTILCHQRFNLTNAYT